MPGCYFQYFGLSMTPICWILCKMHILVIHPSLFQASFNRGSDYFTPLSWMASMVFCNWSKRSKCNRRVHVTSMRTHVYVCLSACVCMCVCLLLHFLQTRTYAHAHICGHTRTHTRTHTYIQWSRSEPGCCSEPTACGYSFQACTSDQRGFKLHSDARSHCKTPLCNQGETPLCTVSTLS